MGRTRWILILCAWTIVGLLFAVRHIVVVKVQGSHVSWVIVGALELVYWYVWAAYTPLVISLAKRFPLTGPRFVPHIAIHTITSLMMAPLASVTEYFLGRGLVGSVFRTTDPGVLRLLPPFVFSFLSMCFTGMLTYCSIRGRRIHIRPPRWFMDVRCDSGKIAGDLNRMGELSFASSRGWRWQAGPLPPDVVIGSPHRTRTTHRLMLWSAKGVVDP